MRHIYLPSAVWLLVFFFTSFYASNSLASGAHVITITVATQDTIPFEERYGDFINNANPNVIDLEDPSSISQEVTYDPETGYYIIQEKIGDDYFRSPSYMTFQEFMDWKAEQQERAVFRGLAGISDGTDGVSGLIDPVAKLDIKKNLIDRLFGGREVDIRPQGNIDLTFGLDYARVDNPVLPLRSRRTGGFDFDMDIRMNVTGKIGEKLNLSTNYNTNAVFDFENQMKIDYNSDLFSEDEILKKIEAGNVSLPLKSSLIQGNQNLFGVKTELQFGRLWVTGIASQQKSDRESIALENGAQIQDFAVKSDNYDENRHFFLTHHNRDVFETALSTPPQIGSLFRILRMEVWVTNDRNQTEGGIRDIVALADLGEPERLIAANALPPVALDVYGNPLPDNYANDLYPNLIANNNNRQIDKIVQSLQNGGFGYPLTQIQDFEKVRARKLAPSEYFVHESLGFISLNINVQPDQVVGVAFEYEYNGQTYRVGELSNQNPQGEDLGVLYVKMLKSSNAVTSLPYWDLMMKNIYYLGSSQIQQEDFRLDVYYEDPGKGIKRFLPGSNLEAQPLIRVLGLDKLNTFGDVNYDGVFDFVPNLTIFPNSGRIMFPLLEPFGKSLEAKLDSDPNNQQYLYPELYSEIQFRAREYLEKNRYTIKGTFKSSGSSSEISLGSFNIPRGSVTVTSGSRQLVEGTDYEVDYNIGKVRILNDALLQPGQPPLNVSYEDRNLFNFQTKTMLGLRAEYRFNENMTLGGTYMHLFERPFTQKVNVGDDPINNRVFGLDFNLTKDAPWLTRLVDAIPLIDTKEPSSITVQAEVAAIKPGHSKAINQGESGGVVYLDDFEGSTTTIDLRIPATSWYLSGVPRGMKNRIGAAILPEGELINNNLAGVNRAMLNWYRIDPIARTAADAANPYTRQVQLTEVFPNSSTYLSASSFQTGIIQTLDLHYKPSVRGPYNFDLPNGTAYSAGVNPNGSLMAPESRWAGIMRPINNSDFETANIEFLEFWMLDPFIDADVPGMLYLQLGNMSEDILRDSRLFFENGLLPTVSVDQTAWSKVPRTQQITFAFDNDERDSQDVGLDGLNNDEEAVIFQDFLNNLTGLQPDVVDQIKADPSNDDFVPYRDDKFSDQNGVFDRYARFNNFEGNSRASNSQFVESATNRPDTEDLNRDNSLNENEAYFQYNIPMQPNPIGEGLDEGNPFITEKVVYTDPDTQIKQRWYRFKIPLDQYNDKVGGIENFRAIRFIRLVAAEFPAEVTLRFARFELVRNQWRRYLRYDGACADGASQTTFEINEVNVEENSSREPFNYVLPPGIQREQVVGAATANAQQNENALALQVNDLCPGGERAIFKNLNMDLRVYKRLQMFVHAEATKGTPQFDTSQMKIFMRIGSDFVNNYYEYELPMTLSDSTMLDGIDSDAYREEVWREENRFDFPLELLTNIKLQRNAQGLDSIRVEIEGKPSHFLSIKGNPNLGLVNGIMVGVRNVSDGNFLSSEIWLNELRLVGLDERGGLAGLARVDMKMADFGGLSLSGNFNTIGYGAIDKKLAQRSRENNTQFDVATNLELGKFFGPNTGLRIPFYYQYSRTASTPQFDPYDLDLELTETEKIDPEAKNLARSVTTIKSFNFTNVRKERVKKPVAAGEKPRTPKPWNIENFSATYAHSNSNKRTPLIQSDNLKINRGAIDYNYTTQAKYIKPFEKINDAKYLDWIRALNINLIPNKFGFSTTMDRQLNETIYRFAGEDPVLNTYYNRRWTWGRSYDLGWDITKALKFNFNANMDAIIDELPDFDENGNPTASHLKKDKVRNGLRQWGRPKLYRHNMSLSYTLPMQYFHFIDWTSVKANVSSDYAWNAASLNTPRFGNVIQNGQQRQIIADLNFTELYSKWDYLTKIDNNLKSKRSKNRRGSKVSRQGRQSAAAPNGKNISDDGLSSGTSKNNNINADDPQPSAAGMAGTDLDKGTSKDKKKNKKSKDKKKDREVTMVEKVLIRPFLLIRRGRLSYSEDYGTTVPGFTPRTDILGMKNGFGDPGWDFITGFQPNDDQLDAFANRTHITDTIALNQPLSRVYSQDFSAGLTLEPLPDFRIEVDVNKRFARTKTELFKDVTDDGIRNIVHVLPREVGSYSISYFAANTMFGSATGNLVELFSTFEDNRVEASKRLANDLGIPLAHLDSTDRADGYFSGYGRFQQDVLIPSFIAAYTGKSIDKVGLSFLNETPRPNWTITYNGLSKINGIKEIFKSFNLKHSYKSTLSVNTYNTAIDYNDDQRTELNPNTLNYYSKFEVPDMVIQEAFSPLLGVDMRLSNDITTTFAWNKGRTLGLSFIDYQLAETRTTSFDFGFGYRIKNVYIKFLDISTNKNKKARAGARPNPNGGQPIPDKKGQDLDIKFNISYRDDVTFNHILDQNVTIPTRGTTTLSLSPTVDYKINKNLSLQLFVNHNRTTPRTSASPPSSNTSAGLTVRFSLGR